MMGNGATNAANEPGLGQVFLGPCDVCSILEGDRSAKAVTWCETCQAWLCARCERNWARRSLAAAIRVAGDTLGR